MQIHEVKSKTKLATKRVVGRGGKRGKTAGRGTKGQKSRAGHRIRPAMRDLIKKLPKLRGEGVSRNQFKTEPEVSVFLSMGVINSAFSAGETVSPLILVKKEIIEKKGGRTPSVKILGTGVIDKKLNVRGCTLSESARAAIEKAGGTVK